jgi:outer membrane lipoprotein-sorting protein
MVKMPSKGSAAANTVYVCLIALLVVVSPSCLVRRRLITRKGGQPVQTLLTSDKESLIKEIARQYESIQTINATVDMAPALGTANKGKVTEYKDVRAYILFRKPAGIRIIGLYPVVRNKAFDMVSDGSQFSLYLPSKNRFIKGANEIEKPSANKLENLRPQHFLDALLVRPIDPAKQETFIENFTDADNAVYKLGVFAKASDGQLVLERELWFERLHLQLVRQLIFDAAGDILTDARYSEWQDYDAVPFPKHIEIDRPKDEYGVVITAVKIEINKSLTDDKFLLDQPPGTQLQMMGAEPQPPSPAPTPPPPPAKKGKKKK